MAKRGQNHITGDIAVRKIEDHLIPSSWITNKTTSDYGLDILVELVVNYETTGRMFFIQAKGTKEPSKNGSIDYSIRVDRLKDYKQVTLPVLLVLYSNSDNLFWGKWVNNLYDLLSPAQKEQESVSIKFSSKNIIDQEYMLTLENSFSNNAPVRFCLFPKTTDAITKRFHNQLLKKAHSVFNELSEEDRLASNEIYLDYQYISGLISVKISNAFGASFKFSGKLDNETFLYYHNLSDSDCPELLWDIILSLAYLQRDTIWSASFQIIAQHLSLDFFLSLSDEEWFEYLQRASKDEFCHLDRFWRLSISESRRNLFSYMMILSLANGTYTNVRTKLIDLYAVESDQEDKGHLAYNIANTYKSTNQEDTMHNALSWYFTAVHAFPKYKELEYWWQEVGSVLYNLGHYFFAELFYKKARRISKERCHPEITLFIADCQIGQFKMHEAGIEIDDYITEETQKGEKIRGSVFLKRYAISCFERLAPNNPFPTQSAVNWFNAGSAANNARKYKKSLPYFIVAWLLNNADKESLIFAFVAAFNLKEDQLVAVLLLTINELFGEEGRRDIINLCIRLGLSQEALDELLKALLNS